MIDLIFNLRIGKLHIQISNQYKIEFPINDFHEWLKRPFIELYQFGRNS